METRDGFIERLSRTYRDSNVFIFSLPPEAGKYDLEGANCPSCPMYLSSSYKLKRTPSGYVCSSTLTGHIIHAFFIDDLELWVTDFNAIGEVGQELALISQVASPRLNADISFGTGGQQAASQPQIDVSSRREEHSGLLAVEESGADEPIPSEQDGSAESWDVEIMYWPPKPGDGYLAWPPRVTQVPYRILSDDEVVVNIRSELPPELQRALYGTESDWRYVSYYDMERSIWVTDAVSPEWAPVVRGRPLLLRHFTVQDDQCLGWEATVEAAGFKVLRPILEGQVEESSTKSKSNEGLDSRSTKRRRVCLARPQSTSTKTPRNIRRDRRERQYDRGSSRGKPSWWMTMSAGGVITGLKEIERLKGVDVRATLRQRFERVFPEKQFALSTVKRMITAFNCLSEDDIKRYSNQDSERPWSEVYARAK
ncbi:SubName: Full=Uncharacterized protein {ECO:0000313/EMBL:CCA75396.1} [Serendipita indica DSM 11827]|uniref:Uncharacterized protein n=1 Tax=Serendipita indica (strain DSM 11827) TaxID=1109443 RepID=G4TVQ3_SERID|nr:SubName: Full=Uncharacterized protein {ECO:0000313/EMBL:CCA75396.1} [Serendipita indica DSM 11827]CCA75396.1 hypothetical protein PIIN_09379 [Serendipita indica DSM 11827]